MSKSLKLAGEILLAALAISTVLAAEKPWSNLGRTATAPEIAAWDIDVRPDGTGLPKGQGSVDQGQEIFDAQCASCHGTFGESNQYMMLAGGVGTLGDETPVRTTGSKLNYATTLWDYINRAMPFQAPKSLSADEVYSLTAYILYLNDILPEDATLDERSILQVEMPNVNGFTQDHGFQTKNGKPDVQNTACMSNCAGEVRVTSQLPEHARAAHGNLADQVRLVGPYRGVSTAQLAAGIAAAELIKKYACIACHAIDHAVIGPAFQAVAAKYKSQASAAETLAAKVRNGGTGVWGQIPMPPQTQLSDADLKAIVEWVLQGAPKQ
jgi:cytochrome c